MIGVWASVTGGGMTVTGGAVDTARVGGDGAEGAVVLGMVALGATVVPAAVAPGKDVTVVVSSKGVTGAVPAAVGMAVMAAVTMAAAAVAVPAPSVVPNTNTSGPGVVSRKRSNFPGFILTVPPSLAAALI